MATVDHLMYGVPDLESGMAEFERLTGVRPALGGKHPGRGTRNALVSLGETVYLEIIAPDPEQPLAGTFGEFLKNLESAGLITWCASHSDLAQAAADLKNLELEPNGPTAMSRQDPKAGLLSWELLFINGHDLGLVVPFLIDWKDSPHPARSTPRGCRLKTLALRTPETVALQGLVDVLGLGVPVESRENSELVAVIETSRGDVKLHAARPLPARLF